MSPFPRLFILALLISIFYTPTPSWAAEEKAPQKILIFDFDLIDYAPLPEVYVGCGFAEWRMVA